MLLMGILAIETLVSSVPLGSVIQVLPLLNAQPSGRRDASVTSPVTVSFAAVLPFRSSLSGLLMVIAPAFASNFTVPPPAAAMAASTVRW